MMFGLFDMVQEMVYFFWCDFVLHVLNFTNAKLYESLFIYLVSDVNARVLN